MKKLLSLAIALTSTQSYSKGFQCEALCIVLDSQNSTVYYLDQINLIAGTSRKETHQLLKKSCTLLAQSSGFYRGSLLVDKLDYWSKKTDETESSQSISSSRSIDASLGAAYRENRSRNAAAAVHYEMGLNFSNSSSSYQRNYSNRELDIRLFPSFEEIACTEDDEVTDGEIPYTGKIDVY